MKNDCIKVLKNLCEESWSNNACLGYILIACDILGYSIENKKQLLTTVEDAFKNYTVVSASEKYCKSTLF